MLEEPGDRRREAGDNRPASPASAAGNALLAVFAHPDDESLACGGLLAWCASVGVRVSLLCVTHGEHGRRDETREPAGRPRVGDVRARELQHAAGVLGIGEVTILDHADGMLPWVNARELETDIRAVMRRTAPDVVITFGADGLYWHPDHIAVHERTTAAVVALGDDAPALYYVTMPAGAMRAVVDHAADVTAGRDPEAAPPRSILGVTDADAFGTLAATPTRRGGDRPVRRTQAAGDHLPPQPVPRLRPRAGGRARSTAPARHRVLPACGRRRAG